MMRELFEYLRLARRRTWPQERLFADQEHRLRVRVRDAYDHVAHYRQLMDGAVVTPEAIRTRADLRQIPVTTKHDLRRLPPDAQLDARVVRRQCLSVRTSGSTGIPMTIYLTPWEAAVRRAVMLRARRDLGAGLFAARSASAPCVRMHGRTPALPLHFAAGSCRPAPSTTHRPPSSTSARARSWDCRLSCTRLR
jgi:phenylacetate-coenzyme A ligase PaaK-like adenylate-forming protein